MRGGRWCSHLRHARDRRRDHQRHAGGEHRHRGEPALALLVDVDVDRRKPVALQLLQQGDGDRQRRQPEGNDLRGRPQQAADHGHEAPGLFQHDRILERRHALHGAGDHAGLLGTYDRQGGERPDFPELRAVLDGRAAREGARGVEEGALREELTLGLEPRLERVLLLRRLPPGGCRTLGRRLRVLALWRLAAARGHAAPQGGVAPWGSCRSHATDEGRRSQQPRKRHGHQQDYGAAERATAGAAHTARHGASEDPSGWMAAGWQVAGRG
mmetsp:Transcript_26641/g.67670  ORF Transcript_26641/g.67670 Transcript_26641/m.67670 type:complete len:270 (-) Transcript_26641:8-817(-)